MPSHVYLKMLNGWEAVATAVCIIGVARSGEGPIHSVQVMVLALGGVTMIT